MIAATSTALFFSAFAQLLSFSSSMPTPRLATVGYIISLETGRFLSFPADGTVNANGDPRK